jgi:hypothetical protein
MEIPCKRRVDGKFRRVAPNNPKNGDQRIETQAL